MKTKKYLGCLAALAMTLHASAQVAWDTNGNTVTGVSEWFGADASSTAPLRIETRVNQPIDWYTNALRRVTLRPNENYTIGSFASQVKNGHMLLSPSVDQFYASSARGPFSLLHLAAATDNGQQTSYRPWMNTGITFTGNADHQYVGQKGRLLDATDMVIHWSDNPGDGQLKDRMRFLFTSGYDNTRQSGASSMEGLEAMRIYPIKSTEAYVGVGDFYAANLIDPNYVQEPTERLDVVNGRVRVRDLPGQYESEPSYDVMVVDNSAYPSPERGVVKAATVQQIFADDCRWNLQAGLQNHMYTAEGTLSFTCPDESDAVGIGVNLASQSPWGKFNVATGNYLRAVDVRNTSGLVGAVGIRAQILGATGSADGIQVISNQGAASGSINNGIQIDATGSGIANNNTNRGLRADLTGVSFRSRGVSAETIGATFTAYAGEFIAHDNAATTHGVSGFVDGGVERIGTFGHVIAGTNSKGNIGRVEPSNCPTCWGGQLGANYIGTLGIVRRTNDQTVMVGVYGRALTTNGNTTNAWAGYFDGNVNVNGSGTYTGTWTLSDASLKTNITGIENARELIAQLAPKRYEHNVEQHPRIALASGPQLGFIAQEVEEVLPMLVKQETYLPLVDSLGTVVVAGETVKAMNYVGLIPVIVAAMQEEQAAEHATNAALTERLAAQDALLAAQEEVLATVREELAHMRESLASCCANPTNGDTRLLTTPPTEGSDDLNKALEGDARHLHIQPNPFTERTTLHYRLERAGRMQLLANSADGKSLKVLQDAALEAGAYQFNWETADLTPGVYYVTLLLDGEPLVKKAVKVMR